MVQVTLLMIHLNQVLPRRAWTRKVPLFLKDPNQCTILFNEELHEAIGTARVVKTFNHFSSTIKKNGTSSRTICEKFYKTDGLHPNRTGSKLLGALISKCVYKALKNRKADTPNVLSEVVPAALRSGVENRSKAQTVPEIHQPRSTLPRMVIRNTFTPPPPIDDLEHYPSLPKLQGVPKVIVQRFGLIAQPLVIRSAKFLQECSRKVAHSRNTLSFAKSVLIFSNERSFFSVFAPLQCLDHIPFELLLFGLSRYSTPEKMRALACLVPEISTETNLVHDVGLCTPLILSQAYDPT